MYIHTFKLCGMRKVLEVTRFQKQYGTYEEIHDVWEKLRWFRYNSALTQYEVAQRLGITKAIYCDMENGVTKRMPMELADKLAELYDVPKTVFLDAFNQFLCDGQAKRIRAYRESFGLGRKTFARQMGIPIRSLRDWESEKKAISRKCWEQYFEGRA